MLTAPELRSNRELNTLTEEVVLAAHDSVQPVQLLSVLFEEVREFEHCSALCLPGHGLPGDQALLRLRNSEIYVFGVGPLQL